MTVKLRTQNQISMVKLLMGVQNILYCGIPGTTISDDPERILDNCRDSFPVISNSEYDPLPPCCAHNKLAS